MPRHVGRIQHGGLLPEFGTMKINLYMGNQGHGPAVARLAERIRTAYATIPGRVGGGMRDVAA